MTGLRIRLLGSFQVSNDSTPIQNLESNKVRALFAYLVVEHNRAHSREKLANLFWPGMTPKRAKSNLSHALYNLRGAIKDYETHPPFLLRSSETIQFNSDSNYWLDSEAFIEQLDDHKSDTRTNIDQLKATVEIYRGDFLEGLVFDSSLAFDEWVMMLRQRFERRVMEGLYLLAETYESIGDTATALLYTWRQVEYDPLDENACRQLMRLLAASGQRNQALAQYNRLQILLAEELIVTPEPETIALRDRIKGEQQITTLNNPKRDNLPAFLTPLIGRKIELAEIQNHCKNPNCRLLTVLGPGGSGKTRLVLEVARSIREAFQHGVFFISLNPIQSSASIVPTIVEALDLPCGEQNDRQNQLINYLRGKNMLLVLDGFEHLLAGASLIADILHQATGIQILVTSRTRLNIKGEQLYLLGGMRYPKDEKSDIEIRDADAVQLLIAGLQRTRSEYEPVTEDLNYLLEICRHVLGMPLGILLAASWGATLSIAEIAGMASRSLDFLATDWADVPTRQRSLRATFDYTWELLSEREQTIFQSLSVFRGAFTRRAAQAVSGVSPHELRNLIDRSLLSNKVPGWYEVHELLRQYGREKLAQSLQVEQEICGLHNDFYLGQLARLGDDLKSAKQVAALSSIDLEHENYRAAWNWSAKQVAIDKLRKAVDVLCMYYDLSLRYADGENTCRIVIDAISRNQIDESSWLFLIRILTWQSRFIRLLGEQKCASQLIDRALTYLKKVKECGKQSRSEEAFLLLEQGNNHFHENRSAASRSYQHSLKLYRSMNDSWGTAKVLGRLGLLAHHTGCFADAVQRYSESLAVFQSLGDPRSIANTQIELGHNSLRQGLVNAGQDYIQNGTEILRQIGDQAGAARGYFELGRACFWTGEFEKSIALMSKSIPVFEDLGLRERLVFSIIALSLGFSHHGCYAEAINQALEGLAIANKINARREVAMAYFLLSKGYLGQGDFEQAHDAAIKSISHYQEIDQKDELAWVLSMMIFIQRSFGQVNAASSYLRQTLEIGINARGFFPVLCGLTGAALLTLDRGDIELALELLTLTLSAPVANKSRWFEDVGGREILVAAESLSPKAISSAEERGRNRDFWETANELLGVHQYHASIPSQ